MPLLTIRCTAEELAMWKRLAKARGKFHKQQPRVPSVSTLVRDGLHATALTVCLCEPGQPVCAKCSKPKETP